MISRHQERWHKDQGKGRYLALAEQPETPYCIKWKQHAADSDYECQFKLYHHNYEVMKVLIAAGKTDGGAAAVPLPDVQSANRSITVTDEEFKDTTP